MSCWVPQSFRKSAAIFVPVLSSHPRLVVSIYTADSWRNGGVFVPNPMQQGPEAAQFGRPKMNVVVRCSVSRASVCCREAVKEMFGAQIMGVIMKGTHYSLELAGPVLYKPPLLTYF